jgi:hypothetical protein
MGREGEETYGPGKEFGGHWEQIGGYSGGLEEHFAGG